MAYAIQTEGLQPEQLEEFDIELGMAENPEDWARAALKVHQDALGMTFSEPDAPVGPSENAEELAIRWAASRGQETPLDGSGYGIDWS